MSEFHKQCAHSKTKTPSNTGALLTAKAFCDCDRCTCLNCPDILELLAITVTNSTCKFNSNMTPIDHISKQNESSTPTQPQNLLDVVNQSKHCGCDVVANAIRDDIPKNLGMSERRNEITDFLELCDKQCNGTLSKDDSSTKINANKLDCASDNKDITIKESNKESKERCSPCGLLPP